MNKAIKLKTMNDAIRIAIEKGGYDDTLESDAYRKIIYAQDPYFWQALGKALGWKDKMLYRLTDSMYERKLSRKEMSEAEIHAHQYFDLVLTGGDTEKFWKELIK